MPASAAGEVSVAVHLPLLSVAIWPPAPQMKLAMASVSLLGAPMP